MSFAKIFPQIGNSTPEGEVILFYFVLSAKKAELIQF